ncbi:TPA: exosome complex exonuclease Rrp41 [Candidatus Micrarchaeota archaeon]|nr:MAG: exosome complex exonuclease Rrp41 [Candidatus Micrarchaeota archaeon CG1_02_51_15]HII39402.1 exosome complex exonuclease Rrp41 [Candidatus Micrarchaeota archaeon]
MGSSANKPQLIVDGKRVSGRGFSDLRNLKITAGVLKKANGSAMIEWGKNRILAAVYGPREVFPKHMTDPRKALINARYVMAPFSSMEEHGRSGPNRRSIEISKVAKHVFENNVLVHMFPKTMININMDVLQSDGGTRVAAVTAASVALVDAGIPVRDLVQGVSIGKIEGTQVSDLDKDEDNYGESDMPAIVSLRTGEVLLYQMDGKLTRVEVDTALSMIFEGAKIVREKQVEALRAKYESNLSEARE